MNLRHACRKLSGVFCSPKPKTSAPCSRRRDARRVKSLSEETRQKPSSRPLCKRSMASITRAMSDAFFPVVYPGGMNGAQLAVEARRIRPELKVLLTSGYTAAALSFEHGLPNDLNVVGKPYQREELAKKLRLVIGG